MIARHHHYEDASAPIPRNQCWRISVVAELLDISVSSVRRLIRDGRLGAVHIGASLRVTEHSLAALLKGERAAQPSGAQKKVPEQVHHRQRASRNETGEIYARYIPHAHRCRICTCR